MTPLLYMRRPALGRMTWRQRQTASLAAMAVLMGLMAIYARPVRAAAPAVPEDPVLLLSSIQQAARKQDYAGVFMYQQGESIQSSRLVHVLDGTGERERLEILDGQPREYLRHNEDVQCLIPERKTVLLERRRGDRFPACCWAIRPAWPRTTTSGPNRSCTASRIANAG